MIAPRNAPIRAVAAPFSPSTPPEGIQNNLVDAGHGTTEEFAKLGQSARGAIALVQTREMQSLGDLFEEYLRNKSLLAAAKEAGVSGLLLQSTRPPRPTLPPPSYVWRILRACSCCPHFTRTGGIDGTANEKRSRTSSDGSTK